MSEEVTPNQNKFERTPANEKDIAYLTSIIGADAVLFLEKIGASVGLYDDVHVGERRPLRKLFDRWYPRKMDYVVTYGEREIVLFTSLAKSGEKSVEPIMHFEESVNKISDKIQQGHKKLISMACIPEPSGI
ncbi:hypothetical protein IPM62_03970 [Candidatus Woesebacteria bacterium]|nr:MAG: hypothetical protein IPM62_03970 [Candidatus Woesebacteria bacterium]